jgi:hypothetical protein
MSLIVTTATKGDRKYETSHEICNCFSFTLHVVTLGKSGLEYFADMCRDKHIYVINYLVHLLRHYIHMTYVFIICNVKYASDVSTRIAFPVFITVILFH